MFPSDCMKKITLEKKKKIFRESESLYIYGYIFILLACLVRGSLKKNIFSQINKVYYYLHFQHLLQDYLASKPDLNEESSGNFPFLLLLSRMLISVARL